MAKTVDHSIKWPEKMAMAELQRRWEEVEKDAAIKESMKEWAERTREAETEKMAKLTAYSPVEPYGLPVRDSKAPSYEWLVNVDNGEEELWIKKGGRERERYVKKQDVAPKDMLRIDWLLEAYRLAMKSELLVRIEIGPFGLALIGIQADEYVERLVSWDALRSDKNPLPAEIKLLEQQMAILDGMKRGKQSETA